MSGLRKGNTLFEAIPALGAISAHGAGRAKLMPVGFEHVGFELARGVNRIGRDPGQNHHVILSHHVSRCHCEVVVSGGPIRVRDLGSHNGTYVNGERINEQELRPGDKLGLSRRVTMMLVMDAELQKPIGVMMDIQERPAPSAVRSVAMAAQATGDRHEPGLLVTAPEPAIPASGSAFVAPSPVEAARPEPSRARVGGPLLDAGSRSGVFQRPGSAASAARDVEDSSMGAEEEGPDPAAVIQELEQQRNVLAILYQISLRCLMAEDGREAEKLIANVLQRLVPLESGFILYQTPAGWRASICPSSSARPSDETVQACYQLAVKQRAPVVVEDPRELKPLGLSGPCSVMVVPLLLNEKVTGVIGTIAAQPALYTAPLVDIVVQIANISAAVLRDR